MGITSAINEADIRVQRLENFSNHPAQVAMLRLDLMHPFVSGNKWFKLKHNLKNAQDAAYPKIATFGGAFSNHLIATAAATNLLGLQSVGIVRGEEHQSNPNKVLQQCAQMGMELHFVSRKDYAQKNAEKQLMHFRNLASDAYWIPEGGDNPAGRLGAAEIYQWIPQNITHIVLSVGSGTTFCGIATAKHPHQNLLGFAPLKGGIYLNNEVAAHLNETQLTNCSITDRFHFGGFGKTNEAVTNFMRQFRKNYHFDLDRVYTAKMMLGLQTLLNEGFFAASDKILCIHSGGLSGN